MENGNRDKFACWKGHGAQEKWRRQQHGHHEVVEQETEAELILKELHRDVLGEEKEKEERKTPRRPW